MGRLFLIVLLALIIYFSIKSFFKPAKKPAPKPKYKKEAEPETEMVQDPECGIYLDPSQALSVRRYGKTYYFCSEECREKFLSKLKRGEEK